MEVVVIVVFFALLFYAVSCALALSFFFAMYPLNDPRVERRAVLWPLVAGRWLLVDCFRSIHKSIWKLVVEAWDIIRGR